MSSPSDAFFAGLTKRQSMLLLVASAFGGSAGGRSFEHLPDDERDMLKECAAKLSAIPRDKRVPFLIQEIKRLMVGPRWADLPAIDPKGISAVLEAERPAVAEVVLRALPAALAAEVRKQRATPPLQPGREIRPEILSVIRWHFERRLEALRPRSASFLISDVVALSTREVMCLVNALGADELAPILASLPPAERETFLASIPASERVFCLQAGDRPGDLGELRARQELDEHAQGDRRHVVRSIGIRLLTRACLGQSVELASRLVEKHRDQVRRLLIHGIRVERAAGRTRDPERLQKRITAQMAALARRGLIEPPSRRQAGQPPSPPARPERWPSTVMDLPPVPPPPGRRPAAPKSGAPPRPSRPPLPPAPPVPAPPQQHRARVVRGPGKPKP